MTNQDDEFLFENFKIDGEITDEIRQSAAKKLAKESPSALLVVFAKSQWMTKEIIMMALNELIDDKSYAEVLSYIDNEPWASSDIKQMVVQNIARNLEPSATLRHFVDKPWMRPEFIESAINNQKIKYLDLINFVFKFGNTQFVTEASLKQAVQESIEKEFLATKSCKTSYHKFFNERNIDLIKIFAAEKIAELDPYNILKDFSDATWMTSDIIILAKNRLKEKNPEYFFANYKE